MNPITKAINEVKFRIPKQILEKVFVDGSKYYRSSMSATVDEQIESLVIRPRVLTDCNLIGGELVMVPLDGLRQEKPMQYTTVIHIPSSVLNGRSINNVLNISFFNSAAIAGYAAAGVMGMGQFAGGTANYGTDNSAAMAAVAGVMGAFDKIPMVSTSRVKLIAHNTICIFDGVNIPTNSYARCILSYDDHMSSIPMRAYSYFSNLVEYAVKAYIYNELIVDIDAGELRYGQTLGVFKNIVETYSDANQNYQDYLNNVMDSTLFMADEQQYLRFIKLTVGGNR
jgi:hypothetical protein